jgi:hypothetical protein
MGAFPVYPRILAAFLKGRWLFRQAFRLADVTGKTTKMPVQELPFDLLEKIRASELDKREGQREPVPLVALNPDTFCPEETRRPGQIPDDDADRTEQAVDAARYALRYFIDAIEDGEAYEGGLEMLNPPLGCVYYMLWLTLCVLEKTKEGKRIKDPIEHSAEFKGERQRFFQLDYARVKAEATLRELLARHGQGEKFFAYAGQYYYLTDSFSDPFVNGLWAVDCGLVPIATKMLRCLYLPTECDTTAPPKPAGSGDDAMS